MAHNLKLDGLGIDDLTALIADAQEKLAGKVQAKREELEKQLAELNAIAKPVKEKPVRQRAAPKPLYRTPDGSFEWSGRGAIPKVFKELGVQSKEDMDKYRIAD